MVSVVKRCENKAGCCDGGECLFAGRAERTVLMDPMTDVVMRSMIIE